MGREASWALVYGTVAVEGYLHFERVVFVFPFSLVTAILIGDVLPFFNQFSPSIRFAWLKDVNIHTTNGIGHRVDRVLSFLSSRPNLDPPPPNPQSIVSLPPLVLCYPTFPLFNPISQLIPAVIQQRRLWIGLLVLPWLHGLNNGYIDYTATWIPTYLPCIKVLTTFHCPLRSGIDIAIF